MGPYGPIWVARGEKQTWSMWKKQRLLLKRSQLQTISKTTFKREPTRRRAAAGGNIRKSCHRCYLTTREVRTPQCKHCLGNNCKIAKLQNMQNYKITKITKYGKIQKLQHMQNMQNMQIMQNMQNRAGGRRVYTSLRVVNWPFFLGIRTLEGGGGRRRAAAGAAGGGKDYF